MRRFVIIGQRAKSTPDFSLDDLPSTSGRLDLLLRAARASLLISHGVRRDTVVYLVLLGGPGEARTIKLDGPTAQFLRPDERSFARMAQKALGGAVPTDGSFGAPTRGVSVASGGLGAALADLGPGPRYLLDEQATVDLRDGAIDPDPVFILGDHLGLSAEARALLGEARSISVGPISIHADDAVAVVQNELDRSQVSISSMSIGHITT